MIVILPKDRISVSWPTLPIYFLAGPVLGGGDWQYKMCRLLEKETLKPDRHDCFVVIPCRYKTDHPLRTYRCTGTANKGVFDRQTDWERYYLNLAAERGSIIFWLGCESKTKPRTDGNPYARDTYGELGEWRGRMMCNPKYRKRILIGADEGFPGLDVIQRNFNQALRCDFRIYSKMEEVAEDAAMAAWQRSKP